jgi:nucleoside phosphorylase
VQGQTSDLSYAFSPVRQQFRENHLDLCVNLALQKVIMVYVFASSKMEAQPVLGLASKVTRSEDTPAIVEQNGNRLTMVITGMGMGNAKAKAEAALGLTGGEFTGVPQAPEKPEGVMVIGLCGGLTEALQEESIVVYADCLTAGDLPLLRCSAAFTDAIVESLQSLGTNCNRVTGITSPRIVSGRSEKTTLATSGASVVDMESYEILSAAARAEVPAAVLRVVSDSLDANMPDFNPALDANGGLNGRKALGIALGSPLKTIRLISANKRAMGRLTPAVRGIFQSNCFSVLKSSAGH